MPTTRKRTQPLARPKKAPLVPHDPHGWSPALLTAETVIGSDSDVTTPAHLTGQHS